MRRLIHSLNHHLKAIWTSERRFGILLVWIRQYVNGRVAKALKWKSQITRAQNTTKNTVVLTTAQQSAGVVIQKNDGLTETGMHGLDSLVNFMRWLNIDTLWRKGLDALSLRDKKVSIISTVSEMITALKIWSYGLVLLGMDRGRKRWSARTVERHIMFHRLLLLSSLLIITMLTLGLTSTIHSRNTESQILQNNKQILLQRTTELKSVQAQKASTQNELQDKINHEANLQAQIKDLNSQLQAKAEAKRQSIAAAALNAVTFTATASANPAPAPVVASVGNCGDNMYKQFIYQHESGCLTDKWNASGCYGIGQACPASKIAQCGADFACQDAFFTNYANSRYGGWAGAYSAWQRQGYW